MQDQSLELQSLNMMAPEIAVEEKRVFYGRGGWGNYREYLLLLDRDMES